MAYVDKDLRYCSKCGRTLNVKEFYQSNNREKFPEGYMGECKKCMTMHVDNWNPDTFLYILQDVDVPWIPKEWNTLMLNYAKDPSKVTGTTILGRYLSKMKLKQYRDFRWADTEFLQEIENKKKEEAMKEQGYSAGEIALALSSAPPIMAEAPPPPPAPIPVQGNGGLWAPVPEEEIEDLDLTDEDRTYLRLKWGKLYKPDEWVALEQLYNDMLESYDIQTAGHIDTLKLLCKTSLKCNQLIDMGDIDGYQKASKVYDGLMKSGNFTAVQNKVAKGEFVDSVGELVMLCEKEGYIERYYVEDPKDKVDETLMDMKRYTHTLVSEETNLNELLEQAIKMNMREDENKENEEDGEIVTDEDIEITDEDFMAFNGFVDELAEADADLIQSLKEEVDE